MVASCPQVVSQAPQHSLQITRDASHLREVHTLPASLPPPQSFPFTPACPGQCLKLLNTHFRSSEMQGTCGGVKARQFTCLVISLSLWHFQGSISSSSTLTTNLPRRKALVNVALPSSSVISLRSGISSVVSQVPQHSLQLFQYARHLRW